MDSSVEVANVNTTLNESHVHVDNLPDNSISVADCSNIASMSTNVPMCCTASCLAAENKLRDELTFARLELAGAKQEILEFFKATDQ